MYHANLQTGLELQAETEEAAEEITGDKYIVCLY
jgi:hypothetical protein